MATQIGQAMEIGFGALAYTGHVVEAATTGVSAEEEVIRDGAGDTITIVTWDPATTHEFTFLIQDGTDTTTMVPPAKNSQITLTPPEGTSNAYRVLDASITFAVGVARLSLSLIDEDSMNAVYS